jgi:hypothetical protein
MSLEGIKPVGDKDDDMATRSSHAHHLGRAGSVVGHMFQHLMREDNVEGTCRERNALPGSLDHAGGSLAGLQRSIPLDLDAEYVPARPRDLAEEGRAIHPHTTAHVEHARTLSIFLISQLHPTAHHL